MQELRHLTSDSPLPLGWGLRILLLTPEAGDHGLAGRLADLGAIVDVESDIYAALDALGHDATGFGLFVMDCDPYGGFDAGHRAMLMFQGGLNRTPTILLSRNCPEQTFPDARHAPTLLRQPLSKVSLHVGFEHALRYRLVFRGH